MFSFGFRPGRSCHDVIVAIYQNVCHKPKWILETDISKCFDKIAHQPLLKKLKTSPFIARQIRGWSAYYSSQCSKEVYSHLDFLLYQKLRAWAYRRHPNKNGRWIASRYWLVNSGGGWVFAAKLGDQLLRLATHSQTPIARHIKVQSDRSPFDGDWSYWAKRTGRHPELPNHIARLLKLQGGKCSYCGLYFELVFV